MLPSFGVFGRFVGAPFGLQQFLSSNSSCAQWCAHAVLEALGDIALGRTLVLNVDIVFPTCGNKVWRNAGDLEILNIQAIKCCASVSNSDVRYTGIH